MDEDRKIKAELVAMIRQRVLPHYLPAQVLVRQPLHISLLGNGHINDTFLVRWGPSAMLDSIDATSGQGGGSLVLQRLNTRVFASPWTLVRNAELICRHLSRKSGHQTGHESHTFSLGRDSSLDCGYRLQLVQQLATVAGEPGLDLGDAGFWRAMSYLDHSCSVEVVTSDVQAEQAARAFGHFARALCDFDAKQLGDVIPAFHSLPGRMVALVQAAADDCAGRLAQCRRWLDFALKQQSLLDELAAVAPTLPLRVCHNDTKINNMLFDRRNGAAMAIIDLDTCMQGPLMYDFGDMVRTFTSPEGEDSTALEKVRVRPEVFTAICRGYLAELGDILTEAERDSLWLGARVMCLMIGVRFLTDHLQGDVYFQVHRSGHNLERAMNQFSLYRSLLAQQATLKACLHMDATH